MLRARQGRLVQGILRQRQRALFSTSSTDALHEEWRAMKSDISKVNAKDMVRMWQSSCRHPDLLPDVWATLEKHFPREITQEVLDVTCYAFWMHGRTTDVISLAKTRNVSKLSVEMVDLIIRAHLAEKNQKMYLRQVQSILERLVQLPAPMWTPQGCRNVMSALGQLRDVPGMFEFLRQMTDSGIMPDAFIVSSLLDACVATNKSAEVAQLLQNLPNLDLERQPALLQACINAHLHVENFNAIPALVDELKALPPHPSTERTLRHVITEAVEAKRDDIVTIVLSPTGVSEFLFTYVSQDPSLVHCILQHTEHLTILYEWNLVLAACLHIQEAALEIFVQCPLRPDTTMLTTIAQCASAASISKKSDPVCVQLVTKCQELVRGPSSLPMFASRRAALMELCNAIDRPDLVLELLPSAPIDWTKPMALAGMNAAAALGKQRRLQEIYSSLGHRLRDDQIEAAFLEHRSSLQSSRLPLPPRLEAVFTLVQERDYTSAQRKLRQLVKQGISPRVWDAFIELLVQEEQWSFAADVCLLLSRYTQVIDLFVARVETTPQRPWIPRSVAMLQLHEACQGVGEEDLKIVRQKLEQVLVDLFDGYEEAFQARHLLDFMRLATEIHSPDLTLRFVPEQAKKWALPMVPLVMSAAAQTNQLGEIVEKIPEQLFQEISAQRAYVLSLLQCIPVNWDAVVDAARNLARRKAHWPIQTHLLDEMATRREFARVLKLRPDISINSLAEHESWVEFLDTLAPPLEPGT
ncbi:hypothetical protein Ae201684P_016337 [Aphanomyces euteiches]|nr:hypothetical protein Ae201684P_016337 [Aphanomyces euteiches]